MPITRSAKKELLKNLRNKKINLGHKKKIRSILKQIEAFVSQNKIKEAKAVLPLAYKELDKAAKVGIIKKNAAARKKGRLAEALGKLS